jgi:heme exporter protein D
MEAVREFLAMGGYAEFVWPSYALTALVMGGLVVGTLRTLRGRQRELRTLEGGGGRRRRAREDAPDSAAHDTHAATSETTT